MNQPRRTGNRRWLALLAAVGMLLPLSMAAAEPRTTNMALGRRYYVQATAWNEPSSREERNYPDRNGTELTDGRLASLDFYDRGWVGWANQGWRIVTIPLAEETMVRAIRMHFLQVKQPAIFLPRAVTYEVSLDGSTWDYAGYDTPGASRDTPGRGSVMSELAGEGRLFLQQGCEFTRYGDHGAGQVSAMKA